LRLPYSVRFRREANDAKSLLSEVRWHDVEFCAAASYDFEVAMTVFVFILAIANLFLGYLAAAALTQPPPWSGFLNRLRNARRAGLPSVFRAASGAAAPAVALAEVGQEGRPTVAGLDELPAGWLVQLASEGIVAETFVEATAHVLRLDISRHREQLVVAETRARAASNNRDATTLTKLAEELRSLIGQWLDGQNSAVDMLAQHNGRLGDHEQAAAALEQALLDKAAQIRTACGVLDSLPGVQEVEIRGKQLVEQITTLLLHVHNLRDRITDLLAMLIRVGAKLDMLPVVVQNDLITGKSNRIGLESLLAGWWADDKERKRPLSAILIDVDRFGRANQRLGTRCGDLVLAALAQVIDQDLVKEGGFERLIRIAGDKFLILQGDVGPHQALTTAERLRQSIEASTFETEGADFDLTISCGVVDVGPSASSLELVRRTYETLRFAKKAGRNRCAIDKGEGPTMLDPPQFPVKAKTISLISSSLS
jgi:diguanylate cyclase (GGDEF)-like protein